MATFVHQDVLWLQIQVLDAFLMHFRERIEQFRDNFQVFGEGEAFLLDEIFQRLLLPRQHENHHSVVLECEGLQQLDDPRGVLEL